VLHKSAVTFDWPRLRKPIPVTLWMGNRGALTDVKNTHPSEFWIRIGFGWGRMGILPAVTIAAVLYKVETILYRTCATTGTCRD